MMTGTHQNLLIETIPMSTHMPCGGSNEYPQSIVLSRNKKNNVYPCKPQFYYKKAGFKGVKII